MTECYPFEFDLICDYAGPARSVLLCYLVMLANLGLSAAYRIKEYTFGQQSTMKFNDNSMMVHSE